EIEQSRHRVTIVFDVLESPEELNEQRAARFGFDKRIDAFANPALIFVGRLTSLVSEALVELCGEFEIQIVSDPFCPRYRRKGRGRAIEAAVYFYRVEVRRKKRQRIKL